MDRLEQEAWKLLSKLRTELQATAPEKATMDRFYPVDLVTLARIEGWTVEEVEHIGSLLGCEIAGKPDWERNAILIATRGENIRLPNKAFTLAHEIAHVALHRNKPCTYRLVPVGTKRTLELDSESERREREASFLAN